MAHEPWRLFDERQRWTFVALLFLVQASGNFDWYVVSVVLEPIKREFHASDSMMGLLGGMAFAVIYALGAIPFARWADFGNRRTVVASALLIWSVMTAACGFVQSFSGLVLARLGVGFADSGATTPAQSLIVDYFPPDRRATAIALVVTGSSVGCFLAIAVGGLLANAWGWRSAFLFGGVSGLALTALIRVTLSEPRLQAGFPERGGAQGERLSQAIAVLMRTRSYVWLLVGLCIVIFVNIGVITFLPSFMTRSLSASLVQISVTWGSAIAVAQILGGMATGFAVDRLIQRDVRWLAWVPALACFLSGIAYAVALTARTFRPYVAAEFLAEGLVQVCITAVLPAIQAVCGHARRATALALVLLVYVLLGAGLGPWAAGALSDHFSSTYGPESLRYALLLLVTLALPAMAAFMMAGRSIATDVTQAEMRGQPVTA